MSGAVYESGRFCDTCITHNINYHRNYDLSFHPESLFDAVVKPVCRLPDTSRRCPDSEGLVEFCIKAFHGNTDYLTRYHHPVSGEGQPRNTPAYGFTDKRE
jgi:hypothetical protein